MRGPLRRYLISFLAWMIASLFGALGLALILIKIFGPIDVDKLASLFRANVIQNPANGVSEFVLFSHKDWDDFIVTTGIMFASNTTQEIIKQWCYIRPKVRRTNVDRQLTLATKLADQGIQIPDYNTTTLREFSLTKSDLGSVVNSHCSFRNSGTAKSKFWMPRVSGRNQAVT